MARNIKTRFSNFPLPATLLVLSSLLLKISAIMTFPEEGVYSLFPHEDLRTGRRTIRFEDSNRNPVPVGDRYQDSRPPPPPLDLGRDDLLRPSPSPLPSRDPFIVDILRPTSQGLRHSNSIPDRPNAFRDRDRERDRLYFSNRSPRVQFHDDERRVYGYGKRYYHDELPPPVDGPPSRETNLIRPSPIDYHRDDSDRRYLPNSYSYHPEAKLPPGASSLEDSAERTRIHIFHPGQPRRNGYHGYRHPDGPAKVDVPGSNAFLNHDEYLEFHTKLALDTLNKEKKKLEEAQKKFATTRPPRPIIIGGPKNGGSKLGGLVPPPNFSQEVTIIQEDHISGGGSSSSSSSCEDDSKDNSIGSTSTPKAPSSTTNGNHGNGGEKRFFFTTSPASVSGGSSSSSVNGGGSTSTAPSFTTGRSSTESSPAGKDTDKRLLTPSTSEASVSSSTETGFLPIVPFHLQGSKNPTATVIKIDPTQNRLSPSYVPSTDSSFKGHVTAVPKPSPTSKPPTQFNLPPSPFPTTSFNLEITKNKTTTTATKTTARVGSADILKVKFAQRPPNTLLTLAPQSTSPASVAFGDNTKEGNVLELATTETVMDQPVSSPSIFIDSQEVNGVWNGTGLNPRDQMMIYVERVKSHWNAERKQGGQAQVSQSTNTSRRRASSNSSSNGTSSVSYSSSAKIESHVRVHESHSSSVSTNDNKAEFSHNALNQSLEFLTESPALTITTGNGINSGVVSKVHAHISHCPKLYGPVEIICDVNIRERHGNPNPFLTVGWIRKFYNETMPDKLLAVNKTLAYEEQFHDKFNVTLAPGTSPMLRSVLIIREVTVPDCGNYECEVFDGVSTHKSETLVFLCH